jgi:hypothetical protein
MEPVWGWHGARNDLEEKDTARMGHRLAAQQLAKTPDGGGGGMKTVAILDVVGEVSIHDVGETAPIQGAKTSRGARSEVHGCSIILDLDMMGADHLPVDQGKALSDGLGRWMAIARIRQHAGGHGDNFSDRHGCRGPPQPGRLCCPPDFFREAEHRGLPQLAGGVRPRR